MTDRPFLPASLPLVTIGIPAYNAGQWIVPAVESALAQTWPKKELLILDDGSSDGTRDRISAYGDRIRLLEAKSGRSSLARQRLLEEASGEWIQWLDHDDSLLPEKINLQIAEAGDLADADVLFSPYFLERWNGGRVVSCNPQPIDDPQDLQRAWLSSQFPQNGALLWRRKSLLSIGGWKDLPTDYYDDYQLYWRAIRAKLRFRFTPTPGAIYRVCHQESLTSSNIPEALRWRARMVRQASQELRSAGEWTLARRAAAQAEYARLLRVLDRLAPELLGPLIQEALPADLWSEETLAREAEPNFRWLVRLLGWRSACLLRRSFRGWERRLRLFRKDVFGSSRRAARLL
ncbi:UDP-Glc:alpha-D-GlcNAc-diphosphoundecaprenol beta-1,3-glucosyltransferase WfgD [Methylacidimicrobium cyclopophantes]|uniref:UDP-Glc:alpha-D-GlcNAc-diphosphoundecaprenol beta-1,3-glucosyltransferase WfgD n=1 Tax=Methylacidimicrobium cyclopophantes TaxID=1041766 RepID=A0A5E6MNJ6_9BACT|nr:glycosyltransferase family 2 protein [Methylacidimicrobium cyclopophantes]VVM07014.1 UDP-Glc:alpha-D-GlcNAc-diphosphoundecaprenol beta-1,3-glucosyltransferase WfgD [Methylacidimicrobium cyclopophantes]